MKHDGAAAPFEGTVTVRALARASVVATHCTHGPGFEGRICHRGSQCCRTRIDVRLGPGPCVLEQFSVDPTIHGRLFLLMLEVVSTAGVVVRVAGSGGLRWRRGTRVAVVRCALLAETAVGRKKIIANVRSLIQPADSCPFG